jgi:hypothetical protein
MLNEFRQKAVRRGASLRWRLVFWLFAAFASVETPLGAQEGFGSKPTFFAGSFRPELISEILPARYAKPERDIGAVGLSAHRFAAIEAVLPDQNGADDVTFASAAPIFARVAPSGCDRRSDIFVAHVRVGFDPRAPPSIV